MSAPSAAIVGRQPECRPLGLIGRPVSRSVTLCRRGVVPGPSPERRYVTNLMSSARPPSAWSRHAVSSPEAVSYTHLDVYKRQPEGFAAPLTRAMG